MTSSGTNHLKDGLIDLTSGSLGGIAVVYVGQPLDTVKVKMQTFPLVNESMMQCMKKTIKTEGVIKGLYAGTVPALVCNVAENSILFLSYGICQKIIQKINNNSFKQLTTLENACAGSMASFVASLAICPTELIKCKLQALYETKSEGASKIGPMNLVRGILQQEGILGLYRGFIPTIAREMPGYFFFFGGYEGCRQLLTSQGQTKDEIGLWKTMTAGGVGGALFWTSTYPIDVAKSRIQVNNNGDSLIRLIVKISKVEGLSALYHGLTPTLVRTIPATAALFVTYEYSKKFLYYIFSEQ
ncbi:mitochondrial ornithine transporter 1 [Coccinella septempunctata]|uniref:mitochondrial ornithine transporter 1 n=1 Tax=Coccinella septempunctata TaxID=41139 RepID=UPI001D0875E9|nr:mitochondrial ornithine transporter 1 [Coccinella septempunctata]